MKTAVTRFHSTGMKQAVVWSFLIFCILQTVPVTGNSFLPDPEISGDNVVCPGAVEIYSTPSTPGNTYLWTLDSGGTLLSNNTASVSIQWDNNAGSGPHQLSVTETDVDGPVTADFQVYIQNANLTCDNLTQISLDALGSAVVTPNLILIGNYPDYDDFIVELENQYGTPLGNTLSCDEIGDDITVKITSQCSGNSCWGSIVVEDKMGPIINCPNTPINVDCDFDTGNFLDPTVTDNCDPSPFLQFLGEEVDNSDICGTGVTLVRHWKAYDIYGNASLDCYQQFLITSSPVVDFPSDTLWTCEQYESFPNITDATPLTGNISTTGSGLPSGVNGLYCQYNATHYDDTLSTCGGLKIIRLWTVLNWCTSTIVTGPDSDGDDNEQIVKVVDITPPVINQDPLQLSATHEGYLPILCSSTGFIPAADVFDACTGYELRIFTPIGELEYVNEVNGAEGGYIPFPGLTIGQHLISYQATDDCGNVSELLVPLTVVDDILPTAICDEITDVNLDESGEALVFAETFDDGSLDNCCVSHFEVKRMGEPDFAFSPAETFYCDDEDVMVVFRVYDCFDNYNECMVQVLVQDKKDPTCVPPANTTINCLAIVDLDLNNPEQLSELFGYALVADNCGAELIEFPATNTTDGCGIGIITRSFQAVDEDGNTDDCFQYITVTPDHDWDIYFPADWYGECGEDIDADDIIIDNFGCDLWSITYSDQYFNTTSDSVCFKIVRTYDVRNWCTADQDIDPIVISNEDDGVHIDETDYNNYGRYTYQQVIKMSDQTAPEIITEEEDVYCSLDENCESGLVKIPYEVSDACTEDVEGSYEVDVYQDGTIEIVGDGVFQKNLPLGCHDVIFTAIDGCGNESQKTIEVCVEDCKQPTPYCHEGLIVEIMQTGIVEIWASDFDAGSFDNCEGELILSFSADTSHTSQVFTCWEHEINAQTPIQLWVTDIYGNQSFCETFVNLQDNFAVCLIDDPIIEGLITTESDEVIENVSVGLSGQGNDIVQTNADGVFTFTDLTEGNDYSITPSKNDDPLNGVTTFDLVKISRHVLGTELLDSPYKMIAADANNSESITTFDLVELRRLILFINEDFSNNSSWRFVDKQFVFPDNTNPWSTDFPEVLDFNNINEDILDADFIAIKIGDVNGNASTNNLNSADDREMENTLSFFINDELLEAGKTYTFSVQQEVLSNILGYQFTLEFEEDKLQLEQVTGLNHLKDENFGLNHLQNGILTASWHDVDFLENSSELEKLPVMELQFKAIENGRLSDFISINSSYTKAEAYRETDEIEIMNVSLNFGIELTKQFQLFQNIPNPFKSRTTVGFELEEAGMTQFSIFDATGKILFSKENYYEAGFHQIVIQREMLPNSGVLFYQMETANQIESKKMLLMD